MSRYIDANKLKKSLSIPCASIIEIDETIIAQIDDQPTADVVEVVRCKDCKHNYRRTTLNHGERDNPSCKYTNYVRDNDFYCGFGERADT